MPSNQLPLSQNIQENTLINNNLSKTTNQKETANSNTSKSELNHQTSANLQSKRNSKSTESEHQSLSSPTTPLPCSALWDNVSNEKMLSSRKNHRFPRTDESNRSKCVYSFEIPSNEFSEKKTLLENDYNQNYQSSTTLFTFVTRQQYLEELQALDEYIFYIK
jgi:hypothetical protein